MTKNYAKYLFGGSITKLAKAVGVSRQHIYTWDDELTDKQQDSVIGAAFRLGVLTVEPQAGLLRKESEFRMVK